MDYQIEILAWNLGHDEADELVDALADVLCERGLGTGESDEALVRSVIALRPMGEDQLDVSNPRGLRRVMRSFTRNARLVTMPGADFKRRSEPLRRPGR